MKHLKLSLIVLGGILLIFSGCQRIDEPQAPELIAPEDGAVFEAEPPTFIWTSDSLFLADAYVIMIFKDSLRSEDTLAYETLEDTTYTMPTEVFDSTDSGTYCWVAAVHWIDGNVETTAHGDPRTFVIKKSESPAGLDLDTTYFPFGRGYEWCYEHHKVGWEDGPTEPIIYDEYDTVTITVLDSAWQGDTLNFQLSKGIYILGGVINIFKDRINVHSPLVNDIKIKPEELDLDSVQSHEFSEECWEFSVEYDSDTLIVTSSYRHYDTVTGSHWSCSDIYKIRCIKEIGVVYQSYFSDDGYTLHLKNPDYIINQTYRLLWFYNGEDTVYKAKD